MEHRDKRELISAQVRERSQKETEIFVKREVLLQHQQQSNSGLLYHSIQRKDLHIQLNANLKTNPETAPTRKTQIKLKSKAINKCFPSVKS